MGRAAPSADTATARLEPHRRALLAHCYRMLGSAFDADDAVQETMLRAWRHLDRYEGRGPFEAWLFRIGTNVCLNMLRGRGRRALPVDVGPAASPAASIPAPERSERWIGPIPDAWLDPADVAVERDSLRLAFVAALQRLPPRQRAALLLQDVLRWSTHEVAELLGTTDASAKSALQRARAAMAAAAPPAPLDGDTADLLQRYVAAFERHDVNALVALLHDDATMAMPPHDLWLSGAADIGAWWRREEAVCRDARLVPVGANGMPAVAQHRRRPDGRLEPFAVVVLDVTGGRIGAIHAFLDAALVACFDRERAGR